MSRLQRSGVVSVVAALAIVAANVLIPQRFDPSALGAILEPYVVVCALIVGCATFVFVRRLAKMLVAALLIVAVVRYAPAWLSFPVRPGAEVIRVSTWNMLAGDEAVDRALHGIAA